MGKLIVNHDKIVDVNQLISICPFGAIEEVNGQVEINSACKMCKICVKKGAGAVTYVEDDNVVLIDKSKWKGIAVYVDHIDGDIHPVTYELIGKAKEMAQKINHPVYAIFMGYSLDSKCQELLHYGVDVVYCYDEKPLERFTIEAYTNVFEDFINKIKPTAILVGATTVGRQLAPRVAARMKTGLTADCTTLYMDENTDLIQIRPAFGGNIMAQIYTPNHRPQMATVRYKVMNAPERQKEATGKIVICDISQEKLRTNVEVLDITIKEKEKSIEGADVLIVAGRGIKKEQDLEMLYELADLLGGQVACTRPLCEAGWMDTKRQVGLSGRTVRPKLIITCGVSGAVQFSAGMNNSDCIIAINTDENASIFNIAHYCLVGDLYSIIPEFIKSLKGDCA